MKKKALALLCVLGLVTGFALFGCGGDSSKEAADDSASDGSYTLISEGKLTIAASLDFPPFENLENGQPVGFTVDLLEVLAEEMGLEAEFLSSVKFDTIAPLVAAGGKADVGASSITITEARKKEVDFTDPYLDSNQSIVVMKDSSYATANDLEGKKVGAQSGTTGYDWAVENIADAEVVPFDEMTAVFAALQAGKIDGIAVDLPVAQYYVKDAYTDAEVVQEIPTGEQYGIVVSQDNPELTKALNDALKAIKENGNYDAVHQKWFG